MEANMPLTSEASTGADDELDDGVSPLRFLGGVADLCSSSGILGLIGLATSPEASAEEEEDMDMALDRSLAKEER